MKTTTLKKHNEIEIEIEIEMKTAKTDGKEAYCKRV